MRIVMIDDVCLSASLGPFGSNLTADHYSSEGVPVLRGSNLREDGGLDLRELVYVPRSVAAQLASSIARPGDIVTPHRGAIGRVSVIPEGIEFLLSSSMIRAKLDGSRVNPYYVARYFATKQGRNEILMHASTVGTPGIAQPLSSFRKLRFPLRSLQEQQAIAEVLGALDDKIAANSLVVEALGALMEALYAESVSAMERLTDLASFVNGRNFTKDATGNGRVVVRISELNSGIGSSTVRNQVEAPDVHLARPGDILFAWSGSLTLRRWGMPEALINQHIFKVIPNSGVPDWLVYQAVAHQMPEYRAIAADKATTMGHIQRRHLDVDVPVPERGDWDRLDATISPLWDRSLNAVVESHTLAQLRDTLLPALMDGTLRVKDAVAQAEEVL